MRININDVAKVLDQLPVVSALTSLVHLAAKRFFLQWTSQDYQSYLKDRSYTRLVCQMIPFYALVNRQPKQVSNEGISSTPSRIYSVEQKKRQPVQTEGCSIPVDNSQIELPNLSRLQKFYKKLREKNLAQSSPLVSAPEVAGSNLGLSVGFTGVTTRVRASSNSSDVASSSLSHILHGGAATSQDEYLVPLPLVRSLAILSPSQDPEELCTSPLRSFVACETRDGISIVDDVPYNPDHFAIEEDVITETEPVVEDKINPEEAQRPEFPESFDAFATAFIPSSEFTVGIIGDVSELMRVAENTQKAVASGTNHVFAAFSSWFQPLEQG